MYHWNPKRRGEKLGTEINFEKEMAENFLDLVKDINLEIQ